MKCEKGNKKKTWAVISIITVITNSSFFDGQSKKRGEMRGRIDWIGEKLDSRLKVEYATSRI